MRHLLLTAFTLALATLPATAQTPAPVELRILAINDFHGNLRPPPGGIRINDPEDGAKKVTVAAGGAEYMATLVKQLRDGQPNTIFVAAGDLIGASPFLSAMFHDEPTIESMSRMGLALSAVGKHEFDESRGELLRVQNGGWPSDRRLSRPAAVHRGQIPLSGGVDLSRRHRHDSVSTVRNPQLRGHPGRLYRADVEGHRRHHLAGERGRPRLPQRGRKHQRAGPGVEGQGRAGDRRADPRGRLAVRRHE